MIGSFLDEYFKSHFNVIVQENIDTHHIIKQQQCKRLGIDKDIRYNMIAVPRSDHSYLDTTHKTNKNRQEIAKYYYDIVVQNFNDEVMVDHLEWKKIEKVYRYSFLEAYSKEYFNENYEDILEGYKILERLSKNE